MQKGSMQIEGEWVWGLKSGKMTKQIGRENKPEEFLNDLEAGIESIQDLFSFAIHNNFND